MSSKTWVSKYLLVKMFVLLGGIFVLDLKLPEVMTHPHSAVLHTHGSAYVNAHTQPVTVAQPGLAPGNHMETS